MKKYKEIACEAAKAISDAALDIKEKAEKTAEELKNKAEPLLDSYSATAEELKEKATPAIKSYAAKLSYSSYDGDEPWMEKSHITLANLASIILQTVRRHINWNTQRPDLR